MQSGHKLEVTMVSMSVSALNILEARAMSSKEYSPDSVY